MLYGAKNRPPSVGPNVWQWIDPLGLDTFKVNRKLGGSTAKNPRNPLSHTYLITTDSSGNVLHTYSWGNSYDKNGGGIWHIDAQDDIKAAKEALDKNLAVRLGDSKLDPFIHESYTELSSLPESERHKWGFTKNCKHDANKLYKMARDKQLMALHQGSIL